MPPLIVFDMDGTLINSANALTKTVNEIRGDMGLHALEQADILEKINTPNFNTAGYFYNLERYLPKHHQLFKKIYMQYCLTEIEVYEGIEALLKSLADRNITLAVATNAQTSVTEAMLASVKLKSYFAHIMAADQVKNPKPASDMLDLLMNQCQTTAQQTLFIGDSDKDVWCANEAGVSFIFVDWGLATTTHSLHIVKHIEQLQEEIDEFLSHQEH